MIVGIDLGTSTSEIAYVNAKGMPEPIPNHLGSVVTPSVVYIDERGEPVVGLEAREKLMLEPQNVFMEVKRMMGMDNCVLKARGNDYTPIQISSFILRYLVNCAETFLNEKVDRAVITVPAYFTDRQRRETIQAGEMAGLKVERIINEPTAAALDYGMDHLEDCKNILVYDLGGGTLDVTVLELFEGVADVKSSCGNNALGGKDFDEALVHNFISGVEKESKIDLNGNLRAASRLKGSAEACKINLSSYDTYDIELPFLYAGHDNQPAGFFRTVARNDFESLIKDKVESTATQINTALSDANLTEADLDLVLLVGGSTKIPFISEFVNRLLGNKAEAAVDPDMAVVRGAAVQGAIIEGTLSEDAIVLTDVCPYTLSTAVLEEDVNPFFPILRCDSLIKRNTTIPVTVSKTYSTVSDYQTQVEITAYQGESQEPEENILLNKFFLSGLPKSKAGKEKVRISFSYDLNGILLVSCESLSNHKSASITINTADSGGFLVEDEDMGGDWLVPLNDWVNSQFASRYRTVISRAEKRLEKRAGDKPELADELEEALNELKSELAMGESDREYLDELRDCLLEVIKAYDAD